MEKIKWKNSFSTGIDLIDEQHKMLIQHLQDVTDAIESSQGEGTIAKTLDFLLDYTHFHFSEEERQMIRNNYPGLEEHRQQHQEFKNSVKELVEDYEQEGAVKDIANHIRDFLFNWLVKHIEESDQKLGQFLKQKEQ
jgi:hemerythrin